MLGWVLDGDPLKTYTNFPEKDNTLRATVATVSYDIIFVSRFPAVGSQPERQCYVLVAD